MSAIPNRVEIILQKMMSVVRGKEMRPLIHDAFECLYEDAGNLADTSIQAANKANVAAARADASADQADIATDAANTARDNANAAASNTEATRQDLLSRVAAGEFKGSKGDKGDTGAQGASGVMAPSSGLFSLFLDSETGNLYADYPEGEAPPAFAYDDATGNLYYLTGDDANG